jgi:hypothetical protein
MRMRWVWQVARMRREMRKKFWPENMKCVDYLEDLDIDGTLLLEWTVEK